MSCRVSGEPAPIASPRLASSQSARARSSFSRKPASSAVNSASSAGASVDNPIPGPYPLLASVLGFPVPASIPENTWGDSSYQVQARMVGEGLCVVKWVSWTKPSGPLGPPASSPAFTPVLFLKKGGVESGRGRRRSQGASPLAGELDIL